MDLQSDLSPLFRDEPPQRPVDERLRAGRRALRRRRVGSVVGVVAVVGALGTTYAVTSGAPTADDTRVATTATPTPAVGEATPKPPEPTALTRYDDPQDEGRLDLVRGYHVDYATSQVTAVGTGTVHEVVPMPPEPGQDGAVGVDASADGVRTWWYVTWDNVDGPGAGSSGASSTEPESGTTFADWVQAQQDLQLDNPPPSTGFDPPEMSDRFGSYTPPPGTEVLRRVDNPLGLIAPYTSVGLEVRDDTGTHVSLYYPSGSTSDARAATIEDLVDRQQKGSSLSVEGPMPPLADTDAEGMPVPRPGVEVLRRIDNPLGVASPRRSVAFTMRFEGRDWWFLWELGPSGYYAAQTIRVARDGYPDLESWLADQTSRADW